jgi:hypothetical protein
MLTSGAASTFSFGKRLCHRRLIVAQGQPEIIPGARGAFPYPADFSYLAGRVSVAAILIQFPLHPPGNADPGVWVSPGVGLYSND